MKKRYILKLALRNLAAHRLRSVLTIMGVAIGVGFVIFLVSLGYGLQRISTQEIANLEALQIIDVTPGKSKIIEITDGTIEKFGGLSNVVTSEPQVNLVGQLSYGTSIAEGVVYGKNSEYLKLEELRLKSGSAYTDNQNKETLINQSGLKQLGISDSNNILGKKIKIKTTIGSEFLAEKEDKPLTKEEEFTVIGVLENESSPYIYVPLEIFKSWGVKKYSSAKVMVSDKKYTDAAKTQLENLGYKTSTLKDTVEQINQFFAIFQLILVSFGAIAILVAFLGMFNTLTISLLEKTREISFMKVLGTESRDIWRMFLGEALLTGLIGATAGVIGGVLLGSGLNNFLFDLARQTNNKPVQIFYIPFVLILLIFAITMLISVLTGFYPSFRASKVDPLEAMRYE